MSGATPGAGSRKTETDLRQATGRRWWQGAVGYEIYIRSFSDSNGDGVGDLLGLRSRLGYIADLGVDLIWITPFYPSPLADHGYDVADYRGVDLRYGTLADVDALLDEAHELGLRVLLDLVPNHTSSEHPWFRSARRSRDDPFRDFYIWGEPAADGGPPNNWVSHFGGPAWSYDQITAAYWLHLFLPEQPDLNWANPQVVAAFDDILRFWLDGGVDGFRIDVAHALVKDPELRDNPLRSPPPANASAVDIWSAYEHRHDLDQPGVRAIYQHWRELVAPYDALLLGEVYLFDPTSVARYIAGQDGLHVALCVTTTRVAWDAGLIRRTLRDALAAGNGFFAWPPSSHDDPRAPTRFGGGAGGSRRALAYVTLLAGLPGLPFLYQGDELGLENGEVPPERAEDPVEVRNVSGRGRDGSRTPMPWEPGPGLGFTTGEPWLPFGVRRREDTVAVQDLDPGSYLNRTRSLLAARRSSPDLSGDTPVEWLTSSAPVVAYRRGDSVVAANCGPGRAELHLPAADWRMVFATQDGAEISDRRLELGGETAAVLSRGAVR
ncbi:MAG: alpha-amylase family glycosyl hydrolase [Nitriliruptorales bacterium]